MQNRVEFEYRMVRVKNAMSKLVDSLVVANTTDVFVVDVLTDGWCTQLNHYPYNNLN